jgi:hypothetical protein
MPTSPGQLLQHKNNTYKHMYNAHQSTVAPAAQKQQIQAHV